MLYNLWLGLNIVIVMLLPVLWLVGLLAFVLFPSLVGSSFADLDQFADWLFAIGIPVGVGVALWVATWPGLSCLKKAA